MFYLNTSIVSTSIQVGISLSQTLCRGALVCAEEVVKWANQFICWQVTCWLEWKAYHCAASNFTVQSDWDRSKTMMLTKIDWEYPMAKKTFCGRNLWQFFVNLSFNWLFIFIAWQTDLFYRQFKIVNWKKNLYKCGKWKPKCHFSFCNNSWWFVVAIY